MHLIINKNKKSKYNKIYNQDKTAYIIKFILYDLKL